MSYFFTFLFALFALMNNVFSQPIQLFKDFEPHSDFMSNSQFLRFKGQLYFIIGQSTFWKTDGTLQGTEPVSSGLLWINEIVIHNDKLYFVSAEVIPGSQEYHYDIYESDGTTSGTKALTDMNAGGIRDLIIMNDSLFFVEFQGGGLIGPGSLYKTDFTSGNVIPLTPYSNNLLISPNTEPAILGNEIIFLASYGYQENGTWHEELNLYKYNEEGIHVIKGGFELDAAAKSAGNFMLMHDHLYFILPEGMYKTDGTTLGTTKISDVDFNTNPGNAAKSYIVFKDQLYFHSATNVSTLWKTDGTSLGTVQVQQVNDAAGYYGIIKDFVIYKDELYFKGYDPTYGMELWKTNGTTGNAVRITDIHPNSGSSNPGEFLVYNNLLFFYARSENSAFSNLYVSDGTSDGTYLVDPSSAVQHGYELVDYKSELYLWGRDQNTTNGLFKLTNIPAGLGKNLYNDLSINIYPNPCTSELSLECENAIVEIKIFNSLGEVIIERKDFKDRNIQMKVEGLPNGFYFMSIIDKSGKKASKKFVKH